jgi:hypothetical protein
MTNLVKIIALMASLLGVADVALPGAAPASKGEARVTVPRISVELAELKVRQGAIIVDTMNPRTFAKYHILGAINLPTDSRENRQRWAARVNFPKNKEIILYCD